MGNRNSTQLSFRIITDKHQAEQYIAYAESKDQYLQECYEDKRNALARMNAIYAPNRVSQRDIIVYQSILDQHLAKLPTRLLTDLHEVRIIQLMPSADAGMPHTRPGNMICYPDLSQIKSLTTLTHELLHIHQRLYHDEVWVPKFSKLGWREWMGSLPYSLESYRRYNPDTIDCPLWIFQEKWVPVPVFRDITHPKLNEVDIWFYNPGTGYHVQKLPKEIEESFPNAPAGAYEHPRELMAYLMAEPEKYGWTF
jgi:hypothetical protein